MQDIINQVVSLIIQPIQGIPFVGGALALTVQAALLGGVAVLGWKIANMLYDKYMPIPKIYLFAVNFTNKAGLGIYKKLNASVKDPVLKAKMLDQLDGLSDITDYAFDQGLRGNSVVMTEAEIMAKVDELNKTESV